MPLPKTHSIYQNSIARVVALALLTGTASAQSQSPSQNETFSIDAPLQALSATGGFTLPDFNSSLGTLESVDLTLSVTNCFDIRVYNSSSTAESFTDASMTVPGGVTGPGDLKLNLSVEAILPSGIAQPGMNVFNPGKSASSTQQTIDSDSLSDWENQSDGVISLNYTKGNATFGGTDAGDNLLFGGTLQGTGKVTVEYTYLSADDGPGGGNPVATPEPGAKYLSALAAGAMVLLLAGRRRLLGC